MSSNTETRCNTCEHSILNGYCSHIGYVKRIDAGKTYVPVPIGGCGLWERKRVFRDAPGNRSQFKRAPSSGVKTRKPEE